MHFLQSENNAGEIRVLFFALKINVENVMKID